MMRRGVLLSLTLTACVQLAVAWRRIGLGRAIWAHSYQSNLLLLSETATLASLDLRTGDLQWRIPHPSLASSVSPRAVLHNGDLVIFALSDERVRAVRVNGDVMWELPGCGIAYSHEENVFPIQMCHSVDYVYVNSTGELIDAVDPEPAPVPTLIPGRATLTWPSGDITILSESDGLLRAMEKDDMLWEREEGLSHPIQGDIHVYETRSVLVLLSELGALFGLDANDGNILWKLKTDGDCKLHSGHKTVTVLTCAYNEGSTTALAIDSTSGEVLRRDSIEHYTAIRGALEDTDQSIPSLRLVSREGEERMLFANKASASRTLHHRPWLLSSQQESFIAAHQNGSNIWKAPIPPSSKIVALAKSQPSHPFVSLVRPPAVRVTGDRRLLHKFVDPNIALVLAHDEKAAETHAMLIDTNTGAIHDVVTHPETALPASAVKGESWFVYSLWNKISMQQELHIIDVFHPEKNESWVWQAMSSIASKNLGLETMTMLQKLTGKEPEQCSIGESIQSATQCSANTVLTNSMSHTIPYVVRSSTLLTQRVRSLDVTQTLMGLTEPAVVLTLESGQVTLVSKFLLDARRPKEMNDAYREEYLRQYRPITSLRSHSRDSLFVDEGKHIPRIKSIAVAPHHIKESICQIAVLGTDLVYSLEHPAGKFDSLPDDFLYSGVIGMILTLIAVYLYTRDLNVKASLAKSWV